MVSFADSVVVDMMDDGWDGMGRCRVAGWREEELEHLGIWPRFDTKSAFPPCAWDIPAYHIARHVDLIFTTGTRLYEI